MDHLALEQAQAASAVIQDLLGPDARAVYLFGSATMAGLNPSSDLDVFAVCLRPTTDTLKHALAERLQLISRDGRRPNGWRPLELTIVAESDIRPWRHPAMRDFQYGEWLRDALDAGTAKLGPIYDSDLALLISMVRQFGVAILGPSASAILPDVPQADVLSALHQTVKDVMPGLHQMPVFALLTLARVWFTFETGEFASKGSAGTWAAERLEPASRRILLRAVHAHANAEARWDVPDSQVAVAAAELVTALHSYGSARD